MAGPPETPEFLDVEMEKLPRTLVLVAPARFLRFE
jgi:hypothetical protein